MLILTCKQYVSHHTNFVLYNLKQFLSLSTTAILDWINFVMGTVLYV